MTIRKVARGAPDPNQNGAKEFVDAFSTFRQLRDKRDAQDQTNALEQSKLHELVNKSLLEEGEKGFTRDETGKTVFDPGYYTPPTPGTNPGFSLPSQSSQLGKSLNSPLGQNNSLFPEQEKPTAPTPAAPSYLRAQRAMELASGAHGKTSGVATVDYSGFSNHPKIVALGLPEGALKAVVKGSKIENILADAVKGDGSVNANEAGALSSALGGDPSAFSRVPLKQFAPAMAAAAGQKGQDRRSQNQIDATNNVFQTKRNDKAAEKAEKEARAHQARVETAGVVTGAVSEALDLLDGDSLIPPAGDVAGLSKYVPFTAGKKLENKLATIRANIAIDTLSAMRASSPTGGAVGNVSDKDMAILQATLGRLETTTDPAQLKETLHFLQRKFGPLLEEIDTYNANGGGSPPSGNPSDIRASAVEKTTDPTGNPSDVRAGVNPRTQGGKKDAFLDPAIQAVIRNPVGAGAAATKSADTKLDQIQMSAPGGSVRVKNKATGKVGTIAKDKLRSAIKSGRFEEVK